MTNLPSKPDILDANITTGVWKSYYGNIRDFISQLPGASAVAQLIVANNTIYPKTCYNEITLEQGFIKGTINVIDINSLPNGSSIVLSVVSTDVEVTLKNNFGGQGSLVLSGGKDLVLKKNFSIWLTRSGSRWVQMNFAGYMFNDEGIIENSKLPKATKDEQGIIQLATTDEVLAAKDNEKAVTSYSLGQALTENRKVANTQSLYVGIKNVDATGNVELDAFITVYQHIVTKATNYVFDTSKLSGLSMGMSFELLIKMSTPVALTFPSNVNWAYTASPDMSKAGQYLIKFTSYDGGASWLGLTEIRQSEIFFESDSPGTYEVVLEKTGIYEVHCIGAGGTAVTTPVYDDTGYLATGGGGAGFIGRFNLAAGSYSVTIGAPGVNNGGASISGVVSVGGGKNGQSRLSAGAGGTAPVFNKQAIQTTLNKAGNPGKAGTGGKGGAPNVTLSGGASLYAGYGEGGGGSASEYVNRCSTYAPKGGYVRIKLVE